MKQGKIYQYGKKAYIIIDKLKGLKSNGYQAGNFRLVFLKEETLSVELSLGGLVHDTWPKREVSAVTLKKRMTAHRKKITAWMARGEKAALAPANKCRKLFRDK